MTKEEILEQTSMLKVVRRYGLNPNRAGFIRCPFHHGDNHASLKLYDKSFYCFGCGKGGDVFTFVELYERCDFHTAFLRLGGTDREKGQRLTNKELLDSYRARRAAEARQRAEERKRQEIEKTGKELDLWRDRLKAAEPLTDEWTEAYNHYQVAEQKWKVLTDNG